MSGPFTTITVDEYYRLKDRIARLEKAIAPIIAWMETHREFVIKTCGHGLLYDVIEALGPLTKTESHDIRNEIGGPHE